MKVCHLQRHSTKVLKASLCLANSGFIKSYERIEILVTLAGDCFDPMVRNREKFLIQSAFTVVPCSAWKETSPREVFKNVAKPSEAKLSLKFLSPMSSKNLGMRLSQNRVQCFTKNLRSNLKYGFCKKSLRKNATLNTQFVEHFFLQKKVPALMNHNI